ncbi:MAG: putative glycolipid-binding domain-containing protein [Micrococcaceae bacterium]
MITTRWLSLTDPATVEQCGLEQDEHGVLVRSTVSGLADPIEYTLRATSAWQFTRLSLTIGDRQLRVERTADGWTVDGEPRRDLAAANDVDLSVSPFSNTLPIRRLELPVGASAEIVTAYVDLPAGTVTTDPQRYTRTAAQEYLYESMDSDFSRTLTVDGAGLVVDYPGLFTREESPAAD